MPRNFDLPTINRPIKDFSGSAVVIGCSQNHTYCPRELHPSSDLFYSIDKDSSNKADLVADIRAPLSDDYKKRFHFTLVEYLIGGAYNDPSGFDNIWDMTQDDGFIVILGCSPEPDFRSIVCERGLKHVEFTSTHSSILIPKNQNLSIEELNQAIANFAQHERECLERVPRTERNSTVIPIEAYCDVGKGDLEWNWQKRMAELEEKEAEARQNRMAKLEKEEAEPWAEALQTQIKNTNTLANFNKIYTALYDGQSSFFKSRKRTYRSVAEIEAYIKKHAHSRTAEAWHLTKEDASKGVNIGNVDLFKKIHRYAFCHSSTFGLFKQSKNFPNDKYPEDLSAVISRAKADSRTGKIRQALGSL